MASGTIFEHASRTILKTDTSHLFQNKVLEDGIDLATLATTPFSPESWKKINSNFVPGQSYTTEFEILHFLNIFFHPNSKAIDQTTSKK